VEEACYSIEVQAICSLLFNYAQEFEMVFAKKDFDILLEHHHWDYTIKLLLGLEPRSSKIYFLSPIEQRELNAFLEENL